MRRTLSLILAVLLLLATLSGCGSTPAQSTPAPTPAPTQAAEATEDDMRSGIQGILEKGES